MKRERTGLKYDRHEIHVVVSICAYTAAAIFRTYQVHPSDKNKMAQRSSRISQLQHPRQQRLNKSQGKCVTQPSRDCVME